MALSEQMKAKNIGRWVLTSKGIERGYLRIEEGLLSEVCYGAPPSDSPRGVVLPAFVNAHTHVGDSVAYPAPQGTVQEIVGPPDGYKHRILRSAPTDKKMKGIQESLTTMASSGTTLFCDFREEGLDGVRLLGKAMTSDSPASVVLGRPAQQTPTDEDVAELLRECDGIGMSASSDWPIDVLSMISRKARAAGKLFAVHASEVMREDIDAILRLRPSYLVHMCRASEEDLEACRESRVPVVVCPSSNRFFGLDPGIPRILKAGVSVALGTDNGMITRPNMLKELRVAYMLSRPMGGISTLEAVNLATIGGRKVLNADAKITTEISKEMDLVVIDVKDDDPLTELVTSARSLSITATIRGGKVWRTSAWNG